MTATTDEVSNGKEILGATDACIAVVMTVMIRGSLKRCLFRKKKFQRLVTNNASNEETLVIEVFVKDSHYSNLDYAIASTDCVLFLSRLWEKNRIPVFGKER